MSLGKRDMSQERLYQDRKDVPPVHFTTPPPPSHHQQQQLECFSDEVDSRGSAEQKEPASGGAGALVVSGGGGDEASMELSKKRRGRPPGSKNKPKPPVVITREAEPAAAMRPHVIEIPCGCDVADALARFAARRNLGICVLAGTGAVANVSLRHPMSGGVAVGGGGGGAPTTAIVFHGQYEILSISATFLPPAMSAVAPQAAAAAACLSISLAGPHGQVVGGAVVGPLYAASAVVLVAAAFTNPTFHRLPLPPDDDAAVSVSVSLSAGSGGDHAADEHHRGVAHQHQHPGEQPPPQEHHRPLAVRRQAPPHLASASAAQPVEPCGGPPAVPIYTACHPQPQDVIWPPPPPPPPY
ncbi:hypothetical protein BDA96_02G241400 [Sorghum bicolor]|jgi:hypothetical protein|uniref:PPC domain-containing protein n=1 Tax=Sorghum bicolor TaxID=4558 RepID=A0A921UWE6_SORBI|nr:hypothetical protein BDA96_02G241400 [Sorghum bicolor]